MSINVNLDWFSSNADLGQIRLNSNIIGLSQMLIDSDQMSVQVISN